MFSSPRVLLFSTMFFFTACCIDDPFCFENDYDDGSSNIQCNKYTFLTDKAIEESIEIQKSKEIGEAGKIYLYGDILLVNEANKGIHIIDNTDKHKPLSKAFIKLWGNLDIAVKEGYLYADSFDDLLVFDIRDVDNISMVTRKKDIFPRDAYQLIPEDDYNFYYDASCGFDESIGMIVEVK